MIRSSTRVQRLVEELAELGIVFDGSADWHHLAAAELDYALHPRIHERRAPAYGSIVVPTTDPSTWGPLTALEIDRRPVGETATPIARRYADGRSSWLVRQIESDDEWAVFDRPAGSERDLVVISNALGAVVVQRHPGGNIRLVGPFGVLRRRGLDWHLEPQLDGWINSVSTGDGGGVSEVLHILLEFAVHDLGARGIGATLVHRADLSLQDRYDDRLAIPPRLKVKRPADLAPLRHALAQVDGAAMFDEDGTLRRIGVRLVPTPLAEQGIAGFKGMRHTSARQYSFDDPAATVIVVSEDGPVTVMRGGVVMGSSPIEP